MTASRTIGMRPNQHSCKELVRTDDEFNDVPILLNKTVKRYVGEKCLGEFHGEGVAYLHGGHIYEGMFFEGCMNGRGVYTWADGVKYEGEFARNVPMGHGAYTWLDGSCYEGEVCFGLRHGVGTYRCANAVIYRGQWLYGKRHGKGMIYYNQAETSWYEGDWVNNRRDGWGVRCYPSGNLYEGQWKNNVRHGEGSMRWLKLGQKYRGTWENGVQQGKGTYTWFLRRGLGSQYPLRNEYTGEFVQGMRHGQGCFLYASGALYKGGWKSNEKHGQGKFIFKNGRIFEGEFVNDRMAEFPGFSLDGSKTPDLNGIRTHTPHPEEVESHRRASVDSGSRPSLLGPDMALKISALLENLPEDKRDQELKQVEFAVLRHIAELRTIYSFYSRLGHDQSQDNAFLLSSLQLWRLLKDCRVCQRGVTLIQMDRYIREDDTPSDELHSPFSTMLPGRFLGCVVVLAYKICQKDIKTSDNTLAACFSMLMKDNIIPNAMNVKGRLFPDHQRAVIAVNYIERCWEIYNAFCKVNPTPLADRTMTARRFIWMFQDLKLFDAGLTSGKLLEIFSAENNDGYDHSNLDLEITFLDFFEALLGCAEVVGPNDEQTTECQVDSCTLADTSRVCPEDGARESVLQCSSQHPSPWTGPAGNSSNFNLSPDTGSVKSLEAVLQLSTPEQVELIQIPDEAEELQSQAGESGGASVIQSPDAERTEESGGTTLMRPFSVVETESNPPTNSHPPSPEVVEDRCGTDGAAGEMDLDCWVQRTKQFFTQRFFPAYEYSLALRKEVLEERLRQKAQDRIAAAKTEERARLREQQEADEERHRVEEEERHKVEEDVAEQGEGLEDDLIPPPAAQSPVASTTSLVIKQPVTAVKKKK
ncbi:hypothetical protein UPYG_G00134760 [Umbra pygmaea]|uniref:Radial spoke head 10 homolog B n=1 Tax=Umbra pygmaea TaxID=75934 RepID=A0ABD0WYB8_UMBPY